MKTPTSRKSNTPYRPKTYDINTIGHVYLFLVSFSFFCACLHVQQQAPAVTHV